MIRLAQRPFLSVQGEGIRTGKLTIFVRFFGCNLRCPGFFQKEPTKPETYVKPTLLDPKSFKTLDDFPVVEYGCDTLYAIDPKYKHLAITYEHVTDLIDEIESLLPKSDVFDNLPVWFNPKTGNQYDICFTGGEPLLHQGVICEIIQALNDRPQRYMTFPSVMQFETNGTQMLSRELSDMISYNATLLNVSPKLFNVTGEDAWDIDALLSLTNKHEASVGFKFVVNATEAAFNELDEKVKELIQNHIYCPIYVMPVGSSFEQQSDYKTINKIAKMAVERGYHISGRLHCILFGNEVNR